MTAIQYVGLVAQYFLTALVLLLAFGSLALAVTLVFDTSRKSARRDRDTQQSFHESYCETCGQEHYL